MKKYILLFIVVFIALGLRLYNLDARGLITDEKFTLVTANGFWIGGANQSAFKKEYFTPEDFWEEKGIQDYFDASAHSDFGTHIIHNGVIHYWMKLFGNSDYAIRLPSVIFNVLTVALIFLLVYKYFKSYWAAFLAALLFAVDPLNVAQSHIARSYPLSFFLLTLSTAYFIRIVRNEGKRNLNFVIYGLLVGLSLLNHYMNFFVPLAQAVVFLFLRNKSHLWKGFIMAGVFNVLLMVYWFNWGGGYTAFGFLESKNEIHKIIAENSADDLSQTIQRATPDLITKKAIELFYNISVLGYDLFLKIVGVKVFFSSLIVFVLTVLASKPRRKQFINYFLLLAALGIVALQYNYMVGIAVSVALFYAVYYGLKTGREVYFLENQKGQFVLLAIGLFMLVVPILFVVNDAFKSGNTTSLTHRYIGNSSPFVAIFIAVGIIRAAESKLILLLLFLFAGIVQSKSICNAIHSYYDDRSVYNAFFEPRRVKNPYIDVARKVEQMYMPGDTLIIPGAYKDKYQERFDKDMVVSYKDAQFLNMYFDKKSQMVQTVDKNERERLYLKRKTGEKVLIFDFKGEEFRY